MINRHPDMYEIHHQANRRKQMAIKLGCRPETVTLFSILASTAAQIVCTQLEYRKAGAKK